jgi:hypothetical protein
MANIDKPSQSLSDLIDDMDRIREELLAVQRGLENMEPVEPSPVNE